MLAGVAFVGGSMAIVPALPAQADHGCGPSGADPCPPNAIGVAGDTTNGWHEEMPNQMLLADPQDACVVRGGVKAGDPPGPSTHPLHQQFVDPRDGTQVSIDDPAHNHFDFIGVTIACLGVGTLEGVRADGGNDGHMIDDYYLPTSPGFPCGANGLCVEDDKAWTVGWDCTFEHDVTGNQAGRHHGSMTESGWSHSSDYSGGSATCPGGDNYNGNGGKGPGSCLSGPNNNKADLTIGNAEGDPNFVKYIRIGNVVDFWGCSNGFPAIGGVKLHRFMGELVIIPDPNSQTNPPFPLCALPGPPGCDLILVGTSVLGDTWL